MRSACAPRALARPAPGPARAGPRAQRPPAPSPPPPPGDANPNKMRTWTRRGGVGTSLGVAAASLAAPWARPGPGLALPDANQKIQSDYDKYSTSYDELDGGAAGDALGIPAMRRDLLARAEGDVLEVAVGTGLNLPFYDRSKVKSLVALDLSEGMLQQAGDKASGLAAAGRGLPITLVQGDAQALPFPDASFDVVVDTFSLCVIRDPGAAVRELARVVRPGGRVLLLENARAGGLLGAYQDLTNDLVEGMSRGCAWNQDVIALAEVAGLKVVSTRAAVGGLIRFLEAAPTRGG